MARRFGRTSFTRKGKGTKAGMRRHAAHHRKTHEASRRHKRVGRGRK